MASVPPWLAVMRSLDGTHAEGDNPAILAWPRYIAQQYPDMASYCAGYTHDSISWCGLTIAYCMAKAGIRPVFGSSDTDRFLWALAWKEFGAVVNKGDEQPGDVLVFVWASGGHHVTLYEGSDGSNYVCHGGNQSHAVNTQHYSKSYCVGIRRPVAAVQPVAAPPASIVLAAPAAAPAVPGLGGELEGIIRAWGIREIGQSPEVVQARQALQAALTALDALGQAQATPAAPAPVQRIPDSPKPVAPSAEPMAHIQKGITATVFGGTSDRETSAYDGHVITNSEPGCSLPSRFPSARPMVCIMGPNGTTVTAPIVDVGPWNTSDAYWTTGSRPQAESGTDMHGRHTNLAGIDLTPATAKALGINGKGKVDWWFASDTQPSPGAKTMNPVTSSPYTTAGGGVMIAGAVGDLIAAYVTKDASRVGTDVLAIVAGITALFAKDFNTTGGTK